MNLSAQQRRVTFWLPSMTMTLHFGAASWNSRATKASYFSRQEENV